MKKATVLVFVLALQVLGVQAFAATGLKSATVVDLKNEVILGKAGGAEHPAVVKDEVAGSDTLRTGKKSRAELEFADKSLARLGSNTIFSFDPSSRKMNLQQGTALIHVPPGQSGAQISTPAATAAILGDVVAMRVNDKGVTQIVALSEDAEGPIQVKLNKTGETKTLHAGEMMTIDSMATKLPQPLTVVVDVFVQSSGLAKGFKKDLPATAQKEIKQAQVVQEKAIRNGKYETTGTVMMAKNGAQQGLIQQNNVNSVLTQAAVGSSFAGTYVGTSQVTSLSGYTPDPLTLVFNNDGTFTATGGDGHTGVGSMNNSGAFTVNMSNGKTITGIATIGTGRISGTFTEPNSSPPPPTDSGVFSVSKK